MRVPNNVKPDTAKLVRAHVEGLRISSMVTGWFRNMHEPKAHNIEPKDVIRILNKAKIKFVLMGAHGISGWLEEPRSTQDIDVLVQKSHHRKAVKAIGEAYPDLIVHTAPAVTRFIDPTTKKVVIDVMKPEAKLYQEALKSCYFEVGKSHRIANLEMALAGKYAAMTSPTRVEKKKYRDKGDFVEMVETNYEIIDRELLHRLGEMVKPGGGKAVLKLVEDAKAGRPLRVD